MKIIYCDNSWQEKWDEFVKNNANDFGLLQSWQWGEFTNNFQFSIFNFQSVYRLAVINGDDNILAIAQIVKKPLKFGKSYFYIPRGPILRQKDEEISNFKFQISKILDLLFLELRGLAQKEKAIFLRFDPALPPLSPLLIKGGKNVGQVQPKETLILDLSKSEEELLAEMKSKTRYNIKVAEKHEVEIKVSPTPSDFARAKSSPSRAGGESSYFEDFWRLTEKTSSRQEIVSHQKDYYQKMIKSLDNNIKLIVAKYQDKIIVANLVIFFGDWCVYLHGASDYEYRNIMAPYLLQWETIKLAQSQGKKYYDFWGVDEKKWPGITRFKTGFAQNKQFTKYIGAWDEIYSKFWYNLYQLVRR